MSRRILGIDPGLAGGLGVLDLDDDGSPLAVALYRTPSIPVVRNRKTRNEYDPLGMRQLLARLLDGDAATVEVALEAQGARPGQGVTSTFRTGLGYGLWLGLVVSARVPYRIVAPLVWKQHAGLIGANKAASRLRAQERFPSVGALVAADEGPAEGLLLAAYVAATRTQGPPHATPE